ncbi:WS/DGAT/MGAT family O-acyltransferase [Mycolicibacterium brumae]|uniref:Diacylglycerol O-acyltransferase n=1 Tax=Mycolicibacterium brumae TaxID=85968 RepID=A0A2G5PD36_9MYCO|nr:wax ester/triacylglycerol synthase family O-acyltransferase [Mycolicibacterium brumae]MCV7191891.1 wax ester/triacylglycerol synthase family O-acyltransferase [Mycolicibacterium brumae]PIB76238.1 wax ester/triacylglycerol synthase family O-acyltransferase [Mycolicibacterium brumae]RWA15730.1 hypothetical protein MBRU_09265 [Mycolicibacterium brumae DSM 44177]UWW07197.1 wax ester/triacylglycerol synthase family O-acyltransferase [Mycolicibacterium brumae]
MQFMSPTDSMFFIAESREHPMHVGGLQLFEPPEGSGPDFLRNVHEQIQQHDTFAETFRKHPATLLGGIVDMSWTVDDDVDMEYHLRRSALPSPGRVRDLLELTGRLHGSLLDRHRPLWEAHLIEGLADGRVAVYTKIHHGLLDGISASKTMQRALTTDPEDLNVRAPWDIFPRRRKPAPESGGRSLLGMASGAVGFAGDAVGTALGFAPSSLKIARAALLDNQLTLPFTAPKTMFNVKIGGARRFAAQSWAFERIRAVKAAAGVTVNDVVLAMCAGALRAYLLEQNALPDSPLIAMVPISLRDPNAEAGGNQVGAILCDLGTHLSDPVARLQVIHGSMRDSKSVFEGLPKLETLALSAVNVAAVGLGAVPGFVSTAPPPFNLVISNVPGPREQMYWGGAKLVGSYPVSIVTDNLALNITLANNAGNLEFGLIGCRRSIPHLQRLLTHLEDALADLEKAVEQ